ncbi:MAG: hypothetical protein PHQ90_08435 [Sulfuricurvum sp.]|uniref:hypothetical protein n=1 Tax=Sulfuricurvum sp. TaxID=2025608 RepID=UPI002613B2FE|nr:hypothetical protein [Sulfuricurvum sp.]MDD2369314.1 hypothetical protein [Sulfuricurvum sp.]MDD2950003.1 hypothetical protein [Sulfuricurvum sp.]MDD5118708.1 hypothetical protein [Sulfuricurvum sp.]
MKNSVVITSWSVDAFLCLTSKLYKQLSVEQISRIESFISAFILYETLYVNEQYSNNELISSLNLSSDNAIKFIKKSDLNHSDDMRDHISFDVDLHRTSFKELSEENNTWQYQHDPSVGESIFFSDFIYPEIQQSIDSNFYTHLRLWQWCLTNEMAEKTNSVCILPKSLNALTQYKMKQNNLDEIILNNYLNYAQFHNQKFIKLTKNLSDDFISELSNIPPLFSIFLSRCSKDEDTTSVLIKLRQDYKEFRDLRHSYSKSIANSKTVAEKVEIVDEWNRSWEILLAGEFKKPQLLKRKVSSTDVSNVIMSIENFAPKVLLKHFIEHNEYKNVYKKFHIYSELDDEIGKMNSDLGFLNKLFGVEKIIPIIKI